MLHNITMIGHRQQVPSNTLAKLGLFVITALVKSLLYVIQIIVLDIFWEGKHHDKYQKIDSLITYKY